MQKNNLSLGQKILGILGVFVFIGIIIWNIWIDKNYEKKTELLEHSGEATVGTVTQLNSGYRSKTYVVFEYYVDGKRYLEETEYYASEHSVNIGERYEVIYYPKDPTVRRLLLDQPIRDPVKKVPLDSLTLDSLLQKSIQQY